LSFKHALKLSVAGAPLLTADRGGHAAFGMGKQLIDLNVTSLNGKDLAWADYVFVSAMIVQRESARALIAQCKDAGSIVAGGPLFTMEYDRFPDDHLSERS
jgi:hypothetical protein